MQLTFGSLSRLGAILAVLATPLVAQAQGLFAPAIKVNDDVISVYELDQRTTFLTLLRVPGDPAELARNQLIQDRLKQQAMAQVGLEVPPEDIEVGMDAFAERANLSREEFIEALAAGGVSVETFRDFVTIGIGWRDYVRGRFLSESRPSDVEIDRALGRGGGGGVRVLMSEIIIPLTPQNGEEVNALSQQLSQITSLNEFSAAAERYSATETRSRGGRLDWLPINDLPPGLQPVILALNLGEVSAPVQLPNAVALFQLRDIQETSTGAPQFAAIEYAIYNIPGGRTEDALRTASDVAGQVDTCNDLYGIAQDQPEEVLERISLPPSEIPSDIALELAKLDPGEISTALTRSGGQTLMLVMLCGRTAELNEDASREDIGNALTQQRLNAFAASFLEQLEADALIIDQ